MPNHNVTPAQTRRSNCAAQECPNYPAACMGPKSDSGVPHAQEAKHLQQQPLRLARHTRTCERTGGIEVANPAVKSGEQRVGRGLVGGEGEAVLSVGLEVGDGESAPARRCLPGGLHRFALAGPLRGPPSSAPCRSATSSAAHAPMRAAWPASASLLSTERIKVAHRYLRVSSYVPRAVATVRTALHVPAQSPPSHGGRPHVEIRRAHGVRGAEHVMGAGLAAYRAGSKLTHLCRVPWPPSLLSPPAPLPRARRTGSVAPRPPGRRTCAPWPPCQTGSLRRRPLGGRSASW